MGIIDKLMDILSFHKTKELDETWYHLSPAGKIKKNPSDTIYHPTDIYSDFVAQYSPWDKKWYLYDHKTAEYYSIEISDRLFPLTAIAQFNTRRAVWLDLVRRHSQRMYDRYEKLHWPLQLELDLYY